MTLVFLLLVANSESRCCPEIMMFGLFLRALFRLKASITGALEFVLAPTQLAIIWTRRPLYSAHRPLFAKPVFAN